MVDDPKPDPSDALNHPESSSTPESGAAAENEVTGASGDSLVTPGEVAASNSSASEEAPASDAAHGDDPYHDEHHDGHHDDDYHDDHYHDDHYHDDHYTDHDPNRIEGEADPNAMTFLEHLEELRKMILQCLAVLAVGLVIALPCTNYILDGLRLPLEKGIAQRNQIIIKKRAARQEKQDEQAKARSANPVVHVAVSTTTNALPAEVGTATNALPGEVAASNAPPVEVVATDATEKVEPELPAVATVSGQGEDPGDDLKLLDAKQLLSIFNMTGSIKVILTVGFWGGILLSAPIMIFFICKFIFPGLKPKEKQIIVRTSGFAVALFATGVAMCYFFTLPYAIFIMFRFADWISASTDVILLNDYISFCLKLMLGFGLAFELPEVLFILGFLGLVNSTQLREKRRHVVVGLLFLAMMLTPPDPMTQMMLAVPLYILFEITIWLIWAKEKNDARREARA
ncbi:MAG: sec-independent protein translocase protein TatC [Kiritimatiellia bacterium]|jgi:sec-independent protein translocase protein TatC